MEGPSEKAKNSSFRYGTPIWVPDVSNDGGGKTSLFCSLTERRVGNINKATKRKNGRLLITISSGEDASSLCF